MQYKQRSTRRLVLEKLENRLPMASNLSFESDLGWTVSESNPDGRFSANYYSGWASDGTRSFQFQRSVGHTSGGSWIAISQSGVDLTGVESIRFDIRDTGIDTPPLQLIVDGLIVGQFANNGWPNGEGSDWGHTAETRGFQIPLSAQAFTGEHTLTLKMIEPVTYDPADPKYYLVDNIQLVGEQVDIALTDAEFTTPTTVKFTYETIGSPGSFEIGFFLSDDDHFDPSDTQIGAYQASDNGSGTFELPQFSFDYVLIVADPADLIHESNPDDNVRSLSRPDIWLQRASLESGNSIQFSYETTGSAGPFQVSLYRSSDGINYDPADLVDVQTVTPNAINPQMPGFFSLAILGTTAQQPFFVVVADPATTQSTTGMIQEKNESNNQKVVKPGSIDVLLSYLQQTFPNADIKENSRFRTVDKQAEIMVKDAVKRLQQGKPDQFLNTYDNAAYAQTMLDYLKTPTADGPMIWEAIYDNRKPKDDALLSTAAAKKFSEIIAQARKDGSFVSRHLTGDAVDISVPKTSQGTIRNLLTVFGASLNTDEHGTGSHWHITYLP
jgi:hypothetical protein